MQQSRGGSHETILVSLKVTEIMTCPISWLTCPISCLNCTLNPTKATYTERNGAEKLHSMNILKRDRNSEYKPNDSRDFVL